MYGVLWSFPRKPIKLPWRSDFGLKCALSAKWTTLSVSCIATSRPCVVRRTYSNYEEKCFAAADPKLWNSLPAELWQADISFQRFRRLLKTFLLRCWDRGALYVTIAYKLIKLYASHVFLLTYLCTYLHANELRDFTVCGADSLWEVGKK